MIKKTKKFILIWLIVPAISLAYTLGDPLVPPCSGRDCNFGALMTLVDNVITFILKYMAVPIAAIMFVYAGFLMVTAGGSEAKTKAKGIFFNTVLGLIFAVAAWLIVKTILSIMGYTDASWIGF